MPQAGYRVVPHTADVKFEAWASTRERCIAEAVAALVASFVDTGGLRPSRTYSFAAPVVPAQAGLLAALNEVIYLLDARGQVPLSTTVTGVDAAELSVSFALGDVTDRNLVGSVPKGISLSGLHFAELNGLWRCAVTVDV